MKIHIYILLTLVFSIVIINCRETKPRFLSNIPLKCETVGLQLKSIELPKGFKISVYEAHQLSMKPDGIIKPCASKLEQVIYYDDRYYYFTNSILFYGKSSLPEKYVRVNGITGETKSTF